MRKKQNNIGLAEQVVVVAFFRLFYLRLLMWRS